MSRWQHFILSGRINLAVSISTVLLLVLWIAVPSWWRNASYANQKEWYPRLGMIFYLYFHFFFYLHLVSSILYYVLKGLYFVHSRKEALHSSNFRTKSSFVMLATFLLGSFLLSLTYGEFYPSVQLPLFSNGKYDLKNLEISEPEILVYFANNQSHHYRYFDVLDEMPVSVRVKVSWSLLNEEKQLSSGKKYQSWLKQKIVDLSGRKDITRIEIYKKQTFYDCTGKPFVNAITRTIHAKFNYQQ